MDEKQVKIKRKEEPQDVGFKLRLIHNQIHKEMEAKCMENEKESLTGMQRWILRFLWEHQEEDMYQRDIEAKFSISRATASNMLQLMEKKGLIHRMSVSCDARLKKIVLTERAKQIQQRAKRDVEEMEQKLLAGLSAEDVDTLHRYLNQMLENLFGEK